MNKYKYQIQKKTNKNSNIYFKINNLYPLCKQLTDFHNNNLKTNN